MTSSPTDASTASDAVPGGPASGAAPGNEYVVRSRTEIVAILAMLQRERDPVTIQLKGEEDFVLSSVLAVDPDADRIVLAYGLDKPRNAALLRAKRLACESAHRDSKL